MRPDHMGALSAAAQRRRNTALARATAALRALDEGGQPITFQRVARHAGVSRQWLYRQPELRAEIERLRAVHLERGAGVPERERATESSLRQRVHALLEENRALREQNTALKHELAISYGDRRDVTS